MKQSRLVAGAFVIAGSRRTLRVEPEYWDAMAEICAREGIRCKELLRRIDGQARGSSTLASAVRVYVIDYFRNAATEEGHKQARHGAGRPFLHIV